jgi:hypothetical protein
MSRTLEYEVCLVCGELIPDCPFSDPRCERCLKEAAMKEWDADLGEYVAQADDKTDDEPAAKVKIKLEGKPALDLIKNIAPKLRKTRKKA